MKLLLALLIAQNGAALESAEPEKRTVKPGETLNVTFKITINPGFHIYPAKEQDGTEPTKFLFDKNTVNLLGIVSEPPTKHHKDDYTEYDGVYESPATFVVRVKVPDKAASGALKVTGKVDGQACDKNGCFPMELPFNFTLTVEGGAAPKQPEPPQEKSKVTVTSAVFDQDAAKAGQVTRVLVKVAIEKTWHIYSVKPNENVLPTKFSFTGGAVEGDILEATPRKHDDKIPELVYEYHEDEAWFVVPVKLAADAKELKGAMEVQPCDPNQCLPPETIAFTAVPGKVEVPQAKPVEPVKPKEKDPAPVSDAQEYQRRGLLGFLLFAMGWGLFALIQPCVYPLIPITVTFFVKQSGESHAKVFFLAVCYALGIIISFTALGFLLTLLMGAAGTQRFASSPWTNLAIAVMFGIFALSMFGLFELKLPDSLTTALGGQRRSGVGGAFILGLIFSVVSFTCTIQGTATILATAAGASTRWAGLMGMLVYSTTMAAPFLLFGIFPSLVKSAPKSGGWLHTVKVTGGFLEIGLAIAYIWKSDYTWEWGFFDRNVVLAIWIGLCFITALYLAGVFRYKGDSPNEGIGFGRLMAALLFAMMGAFLISGYSGGNLRAFNVVLPPAPLKVIDNYEDAENLARKERKPIFLEFTGIT